MSTMFLKIIIYLILSTLVSAHSRLSRILGGKDAIRIDYPYQAVLRRITDDFLICGGAIISHKHILTAAHCVDNRYVSHSNLKINTGGSNATHPFTSEYLPNRIYIHPDYSGRFDKMFKPNNDIAVIRIRENLNFNLFQRMINLADRNVRTSEIGRITGWGTVTYPMLSYASTLQESSMKIIDPISCQSKFPIDIYSDQFCAYKMQAVGPCIGDGGGPLVIDNKIFGIYSMSYLCASGVPDVYTNVYSHVNFILTILRV